MHNNQRRRVVITGLGWVTSLGHDVKQVWADLLACKSGVHAIERFDASAYPVRFGGEVLNYQPRNIEKRDAKRLDRFAQFALDAAVDAVKDADLDFAKENSWRCGSIIGSGIGGIEEFEYGHRKLMEKGPDRLSPFMVPKLMCNAGSGNISIHFGIQGPNNAVASACASAAHAIGDAANAIRYNAADVMITGGSEAALTPLGLGCFVALKALSRRNDDPTHASRPFDKDRDGFILSEGAGVLILEEYEHAKARGANIYAEFLGYGQSADGSHITAPDEQGRGAAYAMQAALEDAGHDPADVDYINAHGTSTPLGDAAETRAVKRLFNDDAYKVAVSSTKSMTGHLLGASGGIEAIITAKAIELGCIPPTANLDNPSEECDLDYVPNEARQLDVKLAMSNSFGFGGHNVSLVLGKI
ncbi:beta-ketoacyl-ACP synthase II [Phycisphaerales bacterium AB-hyl4]|uniref:3-oxoacyl-[acyl-carrier-protein] synthase 2 n=1 Tax=Natronomicrosphaera hydrolytica TaxID=3242702 RepID=A0ABV4TZN7_9BACT